MFYLIKIYISLDYLNSYTIYNSENFISKFKKIYKERLKQTQGKEQIFLILEGL